MKSPIKFLLAGLAGLLVLAIAVLVAVFTLVDPARYRAAVVDAVQSATGRTLTLEGDVGLKLLPCCAVELQQVVLGNPPGFPAEPFVNVRSARLAIRLWPLLARREVAIGTVSIDGLRANLLGRRDGSNNWSFTRPSGAAPAGTANGSGDGVAGFDLAGIDIRDASLTYSDEADGSRFRVEQLQLKSGPVHDGEPFDLSASFRLTDLTDNSGLSARLKALTRVALAGDLTTISFTGLDADLDTVGLAGLDTLTGRVQAPSVEVRVAGDTQITAPGLTADLQLKGADLPGGSAPLKVALQNLGYGVDAGTGTVGALTATATLAGVALEMDGTGTFGSSTDLHGTLRLPVLSPREVLPTLGQKVPRTADPDVLRQFSGSADWFLKEKVAGLENAVFQLDATHIAGAVSRELLPAASSTTPRTRFDLTVDALNVDRYLAPDAPNDHTRAASPDGGGRRKEPPTEIPVATLRALNLEGRARFGRLTVNYLQLADVDLKTSAEGGRLHLEPLAAKLYGGTFRGGLRLDASGARTRLSLDQTFSRVDFGALLTDLADVRNISGTVNLKVDGTAVGTTDDELLADLDGNLSFTLADGVYKGMDVWYEIRRANALLRRTAPPARTGAEETPIRSLDLAGKLNNGELRTERFSAEIPFLRVSGTATVNLPRSTLDSDLTALVFEKPVFPGEAGLENLENMRLPLTVKGPIAAPKVRVDLGRMVQGALKETLRDTLRNKLGLDEPAGDEAPPADGGQAAPPEKKSDKLKKALDRLFR